MVVCIVRPGFFEDANPTSFAALLFHEMGYLVSVLFHLSVRSPGLIVIPSGIHRDAHCLQCLLANQLPGPVQF